MPTFSSASAAAAAREQRIQRIQNREFKTIEDFNKFMALYKSDPRKLTDMDIEKLLTSLRFLDELSESDVNTIWSMFLEHPDGFKYCVGRNIQSITPMTGGASVQSTRNTIKVILLDVSTSMSRKPEYQLTYLVTLLKQLTRDYMSQGHQVLVYYFGNPHARRPYTGAEFLSNYDKPVFNDGATYMQQTINAIKKLTDENPNKVIDMLIVTDGDITDSGLGATVTGLRNTTIAVFEASHTYANVLLSHIRTIENQLNSDVITVHNADPFNNNFTSVFTSITAGLLTTASLPPGIISMNGLCYPSVLLTNPNIIPNLIKSVLSDQKGQRAADVCKFLTELLNTVLTAANTSFVSLIEGRLGCIIRVIASIRTSTERVMSICEVKEILTHVDKLFLLSKELQDKLSNFKDVTVKKLIAEGQSGRADEINKKYAELTQFDESGPLLTGIGDVTHKLVFGGKAIRTPEGRALIMMLLRGARTIESLSAAERALLLGMLTQLKKVPMTHAEKHYVPYSLKNAIQVFQLLGHLITDADTSGFTYNPTVAARIALFCAQSIKDGTEFNTDFADLIESAVTQIPKGVIANLTDLSATSQSNRTMSWMKLVINMSELFPESQDFARLLIISAMALVCKSPIIKSLTESYQYELPACPDIDGKDWLYCTLSDCPIDISLPQPRTMAEIERSANVGDGRKYRRNPSRKGRKRRAADKKAGNNKVILHQVIQKSPSEIKTDRLFKLGYSVEQVDVFNRLHMRAVNSGLSVCALTKEEQTINATAIREFMQKHPRIAVKRTNMLPEDDVFRVAMLMVTKSQCSDTMPDWSKPYIDEVVENFSNASLKILRNMAPNAILELMYNKQPKVHCIEYHPVFIPTFTNIADQIVASLMRILVSKPRSVMTLDAYLENIARLKTDCGGGSGGGGSGGGGGGGGGGYAAVVMYGINEPCPVCTDNIATVSHTCGHALCRECYDLLKKYLDEQGRTFTCPCCRAT